MSVTEIAAGILLQIAAMHPHYDVPDVLPEIAVVDRSTMLDYCPRQTYSCYVVGKRGGETVRAVLMTNPFDPASAPGQRRLSHELMHYVQEMNGMDLSDRSTNIQAEREAEAISAYYYNPY